MIKTILHYLGPYSPLGVWGAVLCGLLLFAIYLAIYFSLVWVLK